MTSPKTCPPGLLGARSLGVRVSLASGCVLFTCAVLTGCKREESAPAAGSMASASVAATAQGATLPPEAKTAAHGWLAEVRRVHTLADGATTETEKRSALSEMTRVFDASTEISRKLEAPARVGVPSSGALGAGAKTSPSSASEVTLLSQDLASRAARIELGLGNGPAALAWAERGLALSKAPSVLRANLLLDAADAHKLSGKPALASPYLLEALRINQGLLDEELAKP